MKKLQNGNDSITKFIDYNSCLASMKRQSAKKDLIFPQNFDKK